MLDIHRRTQDFFWGGANLGHRKNWPPPKLGKIDDLFFFFFFLVTIAHLYQFCALFLGVIQRIKALFSAAGGKNHQSKHFLAPQAKKIINQNNF